MVLKHSEVLGVHDIVIHNYGPSRIFMSLHVEVPADRDLISVHDMIDDIEEELRREYHCTAVIHMDPVDLDNKGELDIKEKVAVILYELDPKLSFHDFRFVHSSDVEKEQKISIDLQVPYNYRLSDEEVTGYLKNNLHRILPGIECEITVDKEEME